jgi:tetratricopeptide (TPR) repeat protein
VAGPRGLAHGPRRKPGRRRSNAAAEELLGSLAERSGHFDHALAHFTRAVALRPTSPYAWAAIVRVKYAQGDTGPSFEAALRRAARLGPVEPEVQRTVADYGLAVWDEVGADSRRAVDAMVTGAMVRDPADTLQVAERRGRLAIACRHVADAPRRPDDTWQKYCASREPS